MIGGGNILWADGSITLLFVFSQAHSLFLVWLALVLAVLVELVQEKIRGEKKEDLIPSGRG